MKINFVLLVLLMPALCFSQNIVINEVMASNQKTILDEDDDASDWIELYNNGVSSIDLTGYGLSDDSLDLLKWRFGNTTIEAGGYLLVYASDKDRQGVAPHTNFKISASGETILISDSNGVLIDKVDMPASTTDISYGRTSDGSLPWIFQRPTPGSQNTGQKLDGIADPVSFSSPGGFYSSQVSLTLSAGNCRIFCTLDGSIPDTTDTEFTAPIVITKTTVVKAVSMKENYLPSQVLTNTYFINESTDLPVVSLSADPFDLFDPTYGMYEKGPGYTEPDPHYGANYWMDWERAAHVEFFEDDKTPGFSEDCGICIYGAWSRAHPQKSFAVKFKEAYGHSKIEYKLFPDFNLTTFKAFILRNSGNDFYYTHIRDAMMQTLVQDLDVDYLEYRPATAFINGEYWGIYNIREKINEHYVANRHGVDPDNIDMLEGNMEVIHGDTQHYQQLIDYISTNDMSTSAAYDYVNSMVDLDECILYFAAQAYYDNRDWPSNNTKYWRERSATGKWRWILFDLDFGFSLYSHGPWEDHIAFMFATNGPSYPNPPWATLLQRKLVENPVIRNKFINQISDLLNTNFKTARVVDTINRLADHIASELPKHRTRWSIGGEDLTKMITFAQQRPAYLRDHVRNYFDCGDDGTITINSNEGGTVKLNTLNLKSENMPFTGVYFQENTIHLIAVPAAGYKFDGWSGAISSQNDTLSLNISRSTSITASFSPDTGYSGGIVINEINYNSSDAFNSGDWIELYNSGKQSIDVSGWIYTDSDTAHVFTLPAGTILGAGQYLVLVEDSTLFTACFPNVKNFIGQTNFGLGGGGESMKLMDAEGQTIDSLEYDDQDPWPTEADGNGATLELSDPLSDNTLGENWQASNGNGSPGTVNSAATAVDEINYRIVPDKFMLSQNYPNPFNPSTTIIYDIPASGHVTLKVFDLLGREVAVLVNENKSAGSYHATWNASGMTSGIYFYRLTAGKFSETKKLVLMK
ncbi:MAG: CotH kinase family protein [Bacteroidetes bacterium]|nr:CotH kinase family protein [Bacteroidota bacterium]